MDAALCLHYGALHFPSTTIRAASIARPYSSFRPSSLSLSSKASTYRALSRHAFSSPVICALNKPSTPSPNYDKDYGKKIVRVVGGASVVLACVLGTINCNYNFSPTAIASERSSQKVAVTSSALTNPKDVVGSLLKVNENLAASKSRWKTLKLKLPDETKRDALDKYKDDLDKFKNDVAYLIKSGKSDEAEVQLRELIKVRKGEPAYEAGMELVALLIFQGRYEDALKCDCLQGAAIPSDGRVPFYKAIIHTMLDEGKLAEDQWNSFIGSFSSSPYSQIK